MEHDARELGKRVDSFVNSQRDEKIGFAVLLFSFDGKESTYVSNAQREDMIKYLRECADRLETNSYAPHGHPEHPANKPGKA
jgi:hypothetical protein